MSTYSIHCEADLVATDLTWEQCVTKLEELRAKGYRYLWCFNNDKCDYDTDGLTEEERDQIEEIL